MGRETDVQKGTLLEADSILICEQCPVNSKRKPPVCSFRVSVCVGVIFWLRIRVTVQVSLRNIALYDQCCPYFSPQATVKLIKRPREHFVTDI